MIRKDRVPSRRLVTGLIGLLITVLIIVLIFVPLSAVYAQTNYQPTPENLRARQQFQDDKFGMFIHWGVYSVLGDGEWILHDRKLTLHDYERLPRFFNP